MKRDVASTVTKYCAQRGVSLRAEVNPSEYHRRHGARYVLVLTAASTALPEGTEYSSFNSFWRGVAEVDRVISLYGPNLTGREPEGTDDLPLCVLAMRCYCAGHARGNSPNDPCDTSETGGQP